MLNLPYFKAPQAYWFQCPHCTEFDNDLTESNRIAIEYNLKLWLVKDTDSERMHRDRETRQSAACKTVDINDLSTNEWMPTEDECREIVSVLPQTERNKMLDRLGRIRDNRRLQIRKQWHHVSFQ